MLCRHPYISSAGHAYGCGQCMPCRFNKRRVWMHRIMLEAGQYVDNSFVTLTYNEENMPKDGSLNLIDYKLFLNRLRGKYRRVQLELGRNEEELQRFRFFLVGEYGDESFRPHYHAMLFNFPTCRRGRTKRQPWSTRALWKECCPVCDMVGTVWGKGDVDLGNVEDDSAGYISGYVVKKMTRKDDPRLEGRLPEFGRMSLKPGIGGDALWEIADSLMKYELDIKLDDVPVALRHGKLKLLPLGRYMRRRLRSYVGKEEKAPQAALDAISKEMLPLRMAARASEEKPSLAEHVKEAGEGKYRQLVARTKPKRSWI